MINGNKIDERADLGAAAEERRWVRVGREEDVKDADPDVVRERMVVGVWSSVRVSLFAVLLVRWILIFTVLGVWEVKLGR